MRLPALTRYYTLFCIFGVFLLAAAHAQDVPPAVPVAEVEAQALPEAGLVVLELFSSQACAFCPKADRLLGDLAQMGKVIALACHVDYFDVRQGSLAQSFCTERQKNYKLTLRSGPVYTPQLVINGSDDAVGYRLEEISEKMSLAAGQNIQEIAIRKSAAKEEFEIMVPAMEKIVAGQGGHDVWLMALDRPHEFNIAEGGHKGTPMTYNNIVSKLESLGPYDGKINTIRIGQNFYKDQQGFVVLIQDQKTGRIIAAGQHILSADKQSSEEVPDKI